MSNHSDALESLKVQAKRVKFNVSELAQKRGKSPRQLYREFKDNLRTSPSKWLASLKIQDAGVLL